MGRKVKNQIDKLQHKHNQLVDKVYNHLDKRTDLGIEAVLKEHEYLLGECDILTIHPYYDIYYEVKNRHSRKGFEKALNQLLRWSGYMKYTNPSKDYYGVFVTHKMVDLLTKNGYVKLDKGLGLSQEIQDLYKIVNI